jgi:uncharacterized protein YceK
MKNFAKLVIFAFTGVLTAGCGSAAGGTDEVDAEVIESLERDFGGPDALMAFFESNSEQQVRAALGAYGMAYVVHHVPTDVQPYEDITACPKYFPTADRTTWHNFNGEHYYIDGSGRPSRAYSYLPPIAAEPRISGCQTDVGHWGDEENPSNDYDGGHMIGSQLGGWGGRANLVPQDANFNRGNWVVLENKVAKCRVLPSGRINYNISVGYSNTTKLVPSSFGMQLTNRSTSASVSLSFTNTDGGGGTNGTNEKDRGVTFLTNQGCN